MMPENIMIIVQSDNIFSENNIYYPDRFRQIGRTMIFPVPATSSTERRLREDNGFAESVRRCLEKLCEFFPAETMIRQLFAASGYGGVMISLPGLKAPFWKPEKSKQSGLMGKSDFIVCVRRN